VTKRSISEICELLAQERDPQERPVYYLSDAAHYLSIPVATLRSWVSGQVYRAGEGNRRFHPIIEVPKPGVGLLSFMNLVEIHVLGAIRRQYGISLQKVRKALNYLKKQFPSRHPLADQQFTTDGLGLFIDKYGRLINITRDGQMEMRKLIAGYLQRIDRDPAGVPLRLYPFTRANQPDDPKLVAIDPAMAFGRPVLAGTGLATEVIARRFEAGDAMNVLADDYGRPQQDIEEAIRWELKVQVA
jgi:uncharacterized protein (DUF433 family)